MHQLPVDKTQRRRDLPPAPGEAAPNVFAEGARCGKTSAAGGQADPDVLRDHHRLDEATWLLVLGASEISRSLSIIPVMRHALQDARASLAAARPKNQPGPTRQAITMQAVSDAAHLIFDIEWHEMLKILMTSSSIHVALLSFHWVAARVFLLDSPEAACLIILCAEKTFPVAVTVISFLRPQQVGNVGLLLIPTVMSHFVQLFGDSLLFMLWNWRTTKSSKTNRESIDPAAMQV
eukprot:TRINITY_DN9132_c0_g1_i1.p1 TRINITY_DN9132_c0_g1~~TRINITY_DN9132_c0_g1_i1.p1  ORF type:complete len:235 (+),score=37.30 TRINITY_DN9132_c0_g1_i1:814-1518(+)